MILSYLMSSVILDAAGVPVTTVVIVEAERVMPSACTSVTVDREAVTVTRSRVSKLFSILRLCTTA